VPYTAVSEDEHFSPRLCRHDGMSSGGSAPTCKPRGAKQTPAEIVAKVEAAMTDLAKAARAVPAAADSPSGPEPEEWSDQRGAVARRGAARYFGGGVVAILEGGGPARGEGPRDRERAAARGRGGGSRSSGVNAESLRPRERRRSGARLDVTIEHPFFGRSTGARRCCSRACMTSITPTKLGKITAAFGAAPPAR